MITRRTFMFSLAALGVASLRGLPPFHPTFPWKELDTEARLAVLKDFGTFCEDRYGVPDVIAFSEAGNVIKYVTAPQTPTQELLITGLGKRTYTKSLDATPREFALDPEQHGYARTSQANINGVSSALLNQTRSWTSVIYAHENIHLTLNLPSWIEEAACTALSIRMFREYARTRHDDAGIAKAEKYARQRHELCLAHHQASSNLLTGKDDACPDLAAILTRVMNRTYLPGNFNARQFLEDDVRFVNTAYFAKENPYYLLFSTIDALAEEQGIPGALAVLKQTPKEPLPAARHVAMYAGVSVPEIYHR